MMFGIDVDTVQHTHNDPRTYDHPEQCKTKLCQRNTDNECKTPHLKDYTESLSLVSVHHSPSLPVLC